MKKVSKELIIRVSVICTMLIMVVALFNIESQDINAISSVLSINDIANRTAGNMIINKNGINVLDTGRIINKNDKTKNDVNETSQKNLDETELLRVAQYNGKHQTVRSGCIIMSVKKYEDIEFKEVNNIGTKYYKAYYKTNGKEENGLNISIKNKKNVVSAKLYLLRKTDKKYVLITDLTQKPVVKIAGDYLIKVKVADNSGNTKTINYLLKCKN